MYIYLPQEWSWGASKIDMLLYTEMEKYIQLGAWLCQKYKLNEKTLKMSQKYELYEKTLKIKVVERWIRYKKVSGRTVSQNNDIISIFIFYIDVFDIYAISIILISIL